jgi:hypothetical protein
MRRRPARCAARALPSSRSGLGVIRKRIIFAFPGETGRSKPPCPPPVDDEQRVAAFRHEPGAPSVPFARRLAGGPAEPALAANPPLPRQDGPSRGRTQHRARWERRDDRGAWARPRAPIFRSSPLRRDPVPFAFPWLLAPVFVPATDPGAGHAINALGSISSSI